MSIVIAEFMDAAGIDRLRARHAVHYDPALVQDRAALFAALAQARGLIVRNQTRVDAELLAAAPRLSVVGRLGVGLDNIDLERCRARGIAVCSAPGANARSVAEYVIAAALILLRGSFGASAAVANGDWPRAALAGGHEAAGKVLGLIGCGNIGRLTGELATALGFLVWGHDPSPPPAGPILAVGLDTLLAGADVVSLHVPLSPATRHLLDAGALARMKPGAVLINTARGGLIDEVALAAALRSGRLAGAALDCFAEEPLPADSPLAGIPNLWLTPHIAGLTAQSNVRVAECVAGCLLAHFGALPGDHRMRRPGA
ncbi:hydroxyacid dehydrogenase [uncultured Thiodictyon sp.]|uniref:hydroxyacid dehydrogenase n=1 Tax=uncultured Thiodictyon sp. TaxID=1846217 RepID=UPI0025D94BEF|nr:hydroxyacid dehydrogenase [uncultured Thiodictyon sp.]